MGKDRAALRQYEAAIRADASSAAAFMFKSDVEFSLGLKAAACESLRKAVEIEPRSLLLRVKAASVLADLGHVEEALEQCQVALRLGRPFFGACQSNNNPPAQTGRQDSLEGAISEGWGPGLAQGLRLWAREHEMAILSKGNGGGEPARSVDHGIPWPYFYQGTISNSSRAQAAGTFPRRMTHFLSSRNGAAWFELDIRRMEGDVRAALEASGISVAFDGADYWRLHALMGELHLMRGNPAKGYEEFRRAEEAAPSHRRGDVLAWRGEMHLRMGDPRLALKALDDAVRLGASRAFCWRGIARMRSGLVEQSMSDLTRAVQINPWDMEACRWKAEARRLLGDYLSWSTQGFELGWEDAPESLSDLPRVLVQGARRRAMTLGAGGQADDGFGASVLQSSDEMGAVASKSANEAERALQRRRLAEILIGLKDSLKQARRGSRRSLLQAHLQMRRGRYAAALRFLDRAIRSAPRDATLYLQRSGLHAHVNRDREALRDIGRALRLCPRNEWLRLARLRLLLYFNRRAEVSRHISRLRRAGSRRTALEGLFYRGCLRFKSGGASSAAEDFKKVLESAGAEGNLSSRARFYYLAAASIGSLSRRRRIGMEEQPRMARLYLCGLGPFPPYTANLEALEAMSRCDVLINNVFGEETRELLSMFCRDIRPAEFDIRRRGDDAYWARRITRLLGQGKVVGFVTRGHPMIFSRLAVRLLRWCKASRVECVTTGAVSSVDLLSACRGQASGIDLEGVQAYSHRVLMEGPMVPDTARPLIILDPEDMEGERLECLRRALERHYPATHECWLFGPVYDMEPVRVVLSDLGRGCPEIPAVMTLYVPSTGEAATHG